MTVQITYFNFFSRSGPFSQVLSHIYTIKNNEQYKNLKLKFNIKKFEYKERKYLVGGEE